MRMNETQLAAVTAKKGYGAGQDFPLLYGDQIDIEWVGSLPSKKNCYRMIRVNGRRIIAPSLRVIKATEDLAWLIKAEGKKLRPPLRVEVQSGLRNDLDNLLGVIFEAIALSGLVPDDSPRFIGSVEVVCRYDLAGKALIRIIGKEIIT